MKKNKIYSLNKSRQILKAGYAGYKKKRNRLSSSELQEIELLLQSLDRAVLENNREEADRVARQTEAFSDARFKKSLPEYFSEMATAIIIALAVATIVRQSWFELYEIPTGSMRPTFKEQDHLTVTKTAFGINIPLKTGHFYFEPEHVQRTSVVIWSGDSIPHLDSDSTFMGVFPYTKRYIKRCMGKPGDTLYFYGGKIYGFDRDGKDLVELRNDPRMAQLEHIPFTRFEGRETVKQEQTGEPTLRLTYHHFNQAIGRTTVNRREFKGEVFNGKEWIKDDPVAQRKPHTGIKTFSDWWGIRNFAVARILNRKELESFTSLALENLEEAPLYLELRHTPSLSFPEPLLHPRGLAAVKGFSTVIPLRERHLIALMKNMYTCRFIVADERASSYSAEKNDGYFSVDFIKKSISRLAGKKISRIPAKKTDPLFPGFPDGSYEFYYGKGVSVGWGAVTTPLKSDSPLLNTRPENIQKLYNLGIDMTTIVEPDSRDQFYFPNRYVYFREGRLYTMGGVLMEADDPSLKAFIEKEKIREERSTIRTPYVAFKDYGPPLTPEGELDKEFIKSFGLKIPEGYYLMLGDNHAMSQDSRYFGPIPQANLQGAPSLIIWPPGERWGIPDQKPYPLFPLSRLIVWSIAGFLVGIWFIVHRRNRKRPVFKKLP